MPIVSMKRAEVEQKGGTLLGASPDAAKEDYFYGLRITLEEPELQKLNLGDNPQVGGKLMLQGVGKLVSYTNDEGGRSATIQLTDLGTADKKEDENRSEVMYPKGES